MTPSPPAFETAATRFAVATGPVSPPATGPIPARMTGYSIPSMSQRSVRNTGRAIAHLQSSVRGEYTGGARRWQSPLILSGATAKPNRYNPLSEAIRRGSRMAGPLDGIKVVEMGVWVAGPSCAAVLADWGADVIKIEPPEGDPFRGLGAAFGIAINPPFELDNRGKRSIALNLTVEDARYIAGDLIDRADVFVSNMRPRALERLGFGYEQLADTNPRLIYCNVTGYGPDTPEANRAAYDVGAFWSRAGVVSALTPPGSEPPQQRGGMGDHMTGANAAGAISAALYNREKTGRGQRVAVSLTRIGVYMMGWDTNTQLRTRMPFTPPTTRRQAPNPIINSFQDSNGRWMWLLMLQADRHWPDFLRALEHTA